MRQERELRPVKKSPFLPRASPSHSCTTEFPLSFHLKNKRDSYTGEPNGDWIRKLRPPEETVKQTPLFPRASQSRSRAPVFTLVPEVFLDFSSRKRSRASREAATTSRESDEERAKNLWLPWPRISLSCRRLGQDLTLGR